MSSSGGSQGLLSRFLSSYDQEEDQDKGRMDKYDQEEKGIPPAGKDEGPSEPRGAAVPSSRRLTVARTEPSSLIPHDDKLLVFRALTGIDTVPALMRNGHSTRTAPNIGIYTRVVRAEAVAKRGFKFYSNLINIFLGTQIIVAAILTALGAANGPHTAVTGFGAINTIIAGAMTYLKGSGLPQRLRHQENEWKVIREYIEQREREFCLIDCPLDVNEELSIVEEMYKTTKSELDTGSSQGAFKSGSNSVQRPIMRVVANAASGLKELRGTEEPKKPEPTATPPASQKDTERMIDH
jgi:hypothetical protein